MKTHLLNLSILILGAQAKGRKSETLLRDSQDDMMVSTDTSSGLARIETQILELKDKYETQPLADENKYESLDNKYKAPVEEHPSKEECPFSYSCINYDKNDHKAIRGLGLWTAGPCWTLVYFIFMYTTWKDKKYIGVNPVCLFANTTYEIHTYLLRPTDFLEGIWGLQDIVMMILFLKYEFPKQKLLYTALFCTICPTLIAFQHFFHEIPQGYVACEYLFMTMALTFFHDLYCEPERAKNQWATTFCGILMCSDVCTLFELYHAGAKDDFMKSTYFLILAWKFAYPAYSIYLYNFPPKKQEPIAEKRKALLTVF
mmetsp:Transcript_19456/g.18684  ORF Transcript_19456/g.18684 Transcript_19456/m.18684 type:complete len:315 (-) Transcript_19456:519-1463(-)